MTSAPATVAALRIVTYACEYCGSSKSRVAATGCDGICPTCGSPMLIEDMFSDRRFVTLPVLLERRAA